MYCPNMLATKIIILSSNRSPACTSFYWMSDEQEITGYVGVALVIHTKLSILVINLNPKVIINQKNNSSQLC